MSAGMADIIACTLSKHRKYVRNEDDGGVICDECGWEVASKWQFNKARSTSRMIEHESLVLLEELAKAGYGNVQEALVAAADAMPIETLEGADKASTWLRQRAHANDTEGRALVQAIHNRKAQA